MFIYFVVESLNLRYLCRFSSDTPGCSGDRPFTAYSSNLGRGQEQKQESRSSSRREVPLSSYNRSRAARKPYNIQDIIDGIFKDKN